MAPRWGGLRPEPYDPDARDADGDGIVQEQTAWERPVGTNLVDELGRAITRGASAGQRPRGMRVVDRNGNDVDYTPTYARPGAAPGGGRVGGATPLAEHGSGSLKERGLPNVREVSAPKPAEDVIARASREFAAQAEAATQQRGRDDSRERPLLLGGPPETPRNPIAVPDNPKYHGVTPQNERGFGNPLYNEFSDWQREQGVTVRGTPIAWDDERVPDTLYHATPALQQILGDGVLKASGAGGLGGDQNDRIVSMTTDKAAAEQIVSDMKLVRSVGLAQNTDGVVAAIVKDAESHGITLSESKVKQLEYYADSQDAAAALNAYLWMRDTAGGPANPLFFDLSTTMGEMAKRDEADFGVVEIPKQGLNNGALITDFDLGKGGLQEIRSYGDVKIESKPTATETPSVKQRIKKKNAEVLGRIKERGGTFGRITKKYKEERATSKNFFPLVTPEEAAKNRREAVKKDLEAFKFFLRTGKAPTKEDGFGGYEEGMYQYLPAWEQRRNTMNPDLVQHIIDTDSDDLISEMEASAVSFHEGLDQSVRVRTKLGPALLLTENGRYLTTHSDDVRSEQSQPDTRQPYEETLGITTDAEADLRPASGYLTHKAFQEEAKRLFEEQNGRPPTEFDVLPMTEGRADIYGGIEMILHPEVAGRTAYGRGDSLNNHSKPALMEDPTDLEIMNALLGCQSKEDNLRMIQGLAYLQASRTGDYSIVNNPFAVWSESTSQVVNNDYIEALVAGSFDLSEVKEVRISPEGRWGISDGPIAGQANSVELRSALIDEFYSPEALREAGMSEDEISFIEENGLVKLTGYDPIDRYPAGNMVSQVSEIRIAKDLEDRFRAAGVEKVVHLHPSGRDMFDTSAYGDDASLGDTAEEIRVARARREIVADLRRTIDRRKNPQQSSGRGGLYGDGGF